MGTSTAGSRPARGANGGTSSAGSSSPTIADRAPWIPRGARRLELLRPPPPGALQVFPLFRVGRLVPRHGRAPAPLASSRAGLLFLLAMPRELRAGRAPRDPRPLSSPAPAR